MHKHQKHMHCESLVGLIPTLELPACAWRTTMGIVYSEESRLLKQAAIQAHGATVALCWRKGQSGQLRQEIVRIDDLAQAVTPALVDQPADTHFWLSQSTLRPGSHGRRLGSVMLLNACWADIDLAHPGEAWLKKYPDTRPPAGDPSSLAALLVQQMIDAGLPVPTYVVWTGGGLCPKWLLAEPLHVTARARWASLQKHILDRIESIRWPHPLGGDVRWPVDRGASDPARILRLVGTTNPRWGAPCWVCWDRGPEYSFDELADRVLPYTRDQVLAWREQQKERASWGANRSKAEAAGIRQRKAKPVAKPGEQRDIEEAISDEAARALWTGRFEFAHAVVRARGGARQGNRNTLLWLMATALSWSCGGSLPQLTQEILALHQDLFSAAGWTREEAMASASTVARRVSEPDSWSTGRYKFKTATWLERLEATPAEIREHGHLLAGALGNRKTDHWQIGSMGFERLKNLPFDQYLAEVRSRQAQAGRRSAEIRQGTRGQDVREKAREMASEGFTSRQIAEVINVNQSTVVRWLKHG